MAYLLANIRCSSITIDSAKSYLLLVISKNFRISISDLEDYTVFRNVCIEADVTHQHGSPSNVYITTFDQQQPVGTSSFLTQPSALPGITDHQYQWMVDNKHSEAPQTVRFATEIAIFAGYFEDSFHIYKAMYFIAPTAYDAVIFAGEQFRKTAQQQLPKIYVIPVEAKYRPWDWFIMTLGLGYTRVSHVNHLTASRTQQCFDIAVFQTIDVERLRKLGIHGGARTSAALSRVNDYMQATTEHRCTSKYALFIQRNHTRRILNIDDLTARAAKLYGYHNIRVVYFENTSIAEQWKMIRCADVLIGVQGAALVWFTYLPPNATFVQLVFDGWHPFYSGYAHKYRRDVTTRVFQCERVTPANVWRRYAHLWFNYSGVIDEHWKQRLIAKSADVKHTAHRYTPTTFKDSNVQCSADGLFNMLLLQNTAMPLVMLDNVQVLLLSLCSYSFFVCSVIAQVSL